jgi:hypothetical protein
MAVHRVGRMRNKFAQLFTHLISIEKARQRKSLSGLHLQSRDGQIRTDDPLNPILKSTFFLSVAEFPSVSLYVVNQ